MVTRSACLLVCGGVVLSLGLASRGVSAAPPAQQSTSSTVVLSEEERAGRATFETVCSACHEAAIATTTRRTRAEWTELLDTMVAFGATASETQLMQVQQYLGRQYGRVNVNRAPVDELQFVLNLPADVAQGIVDYRATTRVVTADELVKVSGFPSARLEELRARIQF